MTTLVPGEDGRHLDPAVQVVDDAPGALEVQPVEDSLQGVEQGVSHQVTCVNSIDIQYSKLFQNRIYLIFEHFSKTKHIRHLFCFDCS